MTNPPPDPLSAIDPPPTPNPPPGAAPGADPPPTPPPPTPPPLTAFAWRHRLVRPTQGRSIAGVCGAFARATNTDPILWRVLLVVLAFFGGVGLVIYLLAWLLLPADGDTAAPVEALAGRGRSRTSHARTIVGLVVVGIALAGYFSRPYRATPLLALLILGGVLLLLLRDRSRTGGTRGAEASPPAAPVAPPPFAPHGPFVPTPPPGAAPAPGVIWSPPPPPRRPRSRLGGVVFWLAILTVGGLLAADLAGVAVPGLAYLAAPLAVLGVGLIVGAWVGRGHWLIPIGVVLCLALGGGAAAIQYGHWDRPSVGDLRFSPTSFDELQPSYHRSVGDIRIDLSHLDFTGRMVELEVGASLGSVEVILPPDVDATVHATVHVGDASVLGETWDGLGNETRTTVDLGDDGPGGGTLTITARISTGSLEVHR